MATLTATLAAVADLLEPLATAGTVKRVYRGEQDSINESPSLEVRMGAALIGRNPEAGILERQAQRLGSVRIWINRTDALSVESARFAPIVDAVEAAFGDAPDLSGNADRFDATGNSGVGYDDGENKLWVDVNWSALSIEPDTFIQDW